MNKIKLLNRHDSIVRIQNYNAESHRDGVIKKWRSQYPLEILKGCKIVCENHKGKEIWRGPILSDIDNHVARMKELKTA